MIPYLAMGQVTICLSIKREQMNGIHPYLIPIPYIYRRFSYDVSYEVAVEFVDSHENEN